MLQNIDTAWLWGVAVVALFAWVIGRELNIEREHKLGRERVRAIEAIIAPMGFIPEEANILGSRRISDWTWRRCIGDVSVTCLIMQGAAKPSIQLMYFDDDETVVERVPFDEVSASTIKNWVNSPPPKGRGFSFA